MPQHPSPAPARRASTHPATSPARRRLAVAAAGLLVLAAGCTSGTTSTSSPAPASPGSGTATAGGTTSGSSGTNRSTGTTAGGGAGGRSVVFNGQGNNLDAYETDPPFRSQRVIKTVADDPSGLDINAQICFFPDGSNRFVAGEDTGQKQGDLQGWGIFQLSGASVGSFSAREVGKLVPTYQGAKDNAENYGCGFLSDGRVLTTDVGNQAVGEPDGQLIVWFPPFDSRKVRYCKIDVGIGTAQSIVVDAQDNVFVASARPPTSGVWRYTGPFPTSDDAAGGCGKKDATGAPMADRVTKSIAIPIGEPGLLAPAGLAPAPDGGLYVSSVITGVINQYDRSGTFVKNVLKPPEGEKLGEKPFSTGTPLGIGVGPDGTLYYADIGIVIAKGEFGPGDRAGSLRRITFTNGTPNPPETMAASLDFPDGIGVWTPRG